MGILRRGKPTREGGTVQRVGGVIIPLYPPPRYPLAAHAYERRRTECWSVDIFTSKDRLVAALLLSRIYFKG